MMYNQVIMIFPQGGRTYAALVTLDRLYKEYDLNRSSHTTKSGAQVKNHTPTNVTNILSRFNENRPVPSEAGRTSRGSLYAVEALLEMLKTTKIGKNEESKRKALLKRMMEHLVSVAGEYHERARIAVEYNPSFNAAQIISETLDLANNKTGAVAQHLVGAKLQIRFPEIQIPNFAASTADVQTKRRGDFQINDTVFHVTVSPNDGHYKKCAADVRSGFRVYLLVRNEMRVAAEQTAHISHSDKISVQSIETFVGQNLDELASFSKKAFKTKFRELLEIYNRRVKEIESDKSLLIEIPENLNDQN